MENYEPIIQARIARMRIVMATSDSARAITTEAIIIDPRMITGHFQPIWDRATFEARLKEQNEFDENKRRARMLDHANTTEA